MSSTPEAQTEEIEADDDLEIADDDYGFILDANGELKTLFMPDNAPFKEPKNIAKIFKILGVDKIDTHGGPATIH